MAKRQKTKTSLQNALRGYEISDKHTQLEADLVNLYETMTDMERVEAIIKRIQRHIVEVNGLTIDDDFNQIEQDLLDDIHWGIRYHLKKCIAFFLSDKQREFIVRQHALGLTTADAAWRLINQDDVINRLAQQDALGTKELKETLIQRLSYLKPTSSRWSEKKYGAVWTQAREQYKQAIADIPLSSQVEQVALLTKHVDRMDKMIDSQLDKQNLDWKDFIALSNSLVKTVVSLNQMTTIDNPPIPINLTALEQHQLIAKLSAPQFIAFLQRLTLQLKAPNQQIIDGEAKELVAGLEQLTVALQLPAQQGNGNGEVKALPTEAEATNQQTTPAP
ncbi:MAG: hypothetical protein F4Z01_06875 [Gammaproteobacteria bacterium]|nr:hypothetical protein [Gammaproteobacteria bacterium]